MATIQDPLAKPVWPQLETGVGEAIVSRLVTLLAPLKVADPALTGVFERITVGFNSTMAAIEHATLASRFSAKKGLNEKSGANHEGSAKEEKLAAIIVCRSDLSSILCAPLGLASAATRIPIIALPKGSKSRLAAASGRDDVGVIGLRKHADAQISALITDVGPASADWAYRPCAIVPRGQPKKRAAGPKPRLQKRKYKIKTPIQRP